MNQNVGPHNPWSKLATTFGSKMENVMLQFVRLEMMASYMCYNWKNLFIFVHGLFNKVESSKKF